MVSKLFVMLSVLAFGSFGANYQDVDKNCRGCTLTPAVDTSGFVKFERVLKAFTEKSGTCAVKDSKCAEETKCSVSGSLVITNLPGTSTAYYLAGPGVRIPIKPGKSLTIAIGPMKLSCGPDDKGNPTNEFAVKVQVGEFVESLTWKCSKCDWIDPTPTRIPPVKEN